MILLLDTSISLCRLGVVDDELNVEWHEWQADRELSKGLLKYILTTLGEYDATFTDISGIGVYQGPGSFTGLRIGLTVMNTLADSLKIPIVGVAENDQWSEVAMADLRAGKNSQIVMPHYGSNAHITKPRK